jgi:hypothetical protein
MMILFVTCVFLFGDVSYSEVFLFGDVIGPPPMLLLNNIKSVLLNTVTNRRRLLG